MNAQEDLEYTPQVRPWIRLWARSIDLFLGGSVWGLILETIGPPVSTKFVVTCVLYAFLWAPVEAVLLSTWGTTPGKWLLQITLRDSKGSKLQFSAALSRSLYVWAWGLGMGYPYATLVAEAFTYMDLQNKGTTRWDRVGGFRISHGTIGTHRGVVTIILLLCLTVMFSFSAELITITSSAPSTMTIVGVLLVISLASLVSLKAEDADRVPNDSR